MTAGTITSESTNLRFDGSVWCNVDVALRNLDQIYRRAVRPLGLTVIEWYILRALYEQDGQHASELARAVGRAATSFTPNIDKLEKKNLIERRPDPGDRRAVRIYLTKHGESRRNKVLQVAKTIDTEIENRFNADNLAIFQDVLATLQTLNLD